MALLTQADSGPLPLPQAALGTGALKEMPGETEEGAQLQAAALTCYQQAACLGLLEVCHQSTFVFYRINSL